MGLFWANIQQGGEAPSPSPIPTNGLSAWYGDLVNDGVARTTLSDGDPITQWDDQSGNEYHLDTVVGTPVWDATKGYMDFDAGGVYNITHPIIIGSTNRTIFLVGEVGELVAQDNLFFGNYTSGDAGGYWQVQVSNSGYSPIDINAGWRRFTTSNVIDTQYLFTSYNNGTIMSDVGLRKNGVELSQHSILNSTLTIDTNVGGTGGGGYIDAVSGLMVNRGDVRNKEIIVYDRLLSAGEITQVEDYLQIKYFGKAPITAGLTVHYGDMVNDGVDRKTLADATTITQWDDMSGNGYHFIGYNSPAYNASTDTISVAGTKHFRTAGGNLDGSPLTNEMTIFNVGTYSVEPRYYLATGTNDFAVLSNQGTPEIWEDFGTDITTRTGYGAAADYTTSELILTTHIFSDSESIHAGRTNGVEVFSLTEGNNITDNFVALGRNSKTSSNYGSWNSAEILIYDRKLSAAEIIEVETWLNNKYTLY